MATPHKPARSPAQDKTQTEGLTQPQFGTTGGASISSQTGSAGSESGGAQLGTTESAAAKPQTGADATQGDAQFGAKKPPAVDDSARGPTKPPSRRRN